MSNPAPRPLSFDRFVFDFADQRLVGPNGPIHIGHKAFRVLGLLAAEPGRLVTKDELFESAWNGAAVSESTLTSVIKELRRALGDDSHQPRFIQSVYGRGYRFVVPVTALTQADTASMAERALTSNEGAIWDWFGRRARTVAATLSAVVGALALGNFLQSAATPHANAEVVRYAGFSAPGQSGAAAEIAAAIEGEAQAAFNAESPIGLVGADSAAAEGAAFALSGSVRQSGARIRVLTTISDAATRGEVFTWSQDYPAEEPARVPRMAAIENMGMMRCALETMSGSHAQLALATVRLVYQHCDAQRQGQWERALDFSRSLAKAEPKFSGGWAGIAKDASVLLDGKPTEDRAALMTEADAATKRTLALDPDNGRVWIDMALRRPAFAWAERERLFRRAIAARPLGCGCAHELLGTLLLSTGRLREGEREMRRALDMTPTERDDRQLLIDGLLQQGKVAEAQRELSAFAELLPVTEKVPRLMVMNAVYWGDYDKALRGLDDRELPIPPQARATLKAAYGALRSGDAGARAAAVPRVLAMGRREPRLQVPALGLLAALGAPREAVALAEGIRPESSSLLFIDMMGPNFTEVRRLPEWWALVDRLGLVAYWSATRSRPDFCIGADAPPQCRTLG